MQSFLFLIEFYYFPQTRLYEILQMLRSIEFPLQFIQLDDQKLGISGIF